MYMQCQVLSRLLLLYTFNICFIFNVESYRKVREASDNLLLLLEMTISGVKCRERENACWGHSECSTRHIKWFNQSCLWRYVYFIKYSCFCQSYDTFPYDWFIENINSKINKDKRSWVLAIVKNLWLRDTDVSNVFVVQKWYQFPM